MAPLVAGIAVLNAVGLLVAALGERTSALGRTRLRRSERLRFLRAWLRDPMRLRAVGLVGPEAAHDRVPSRVPKAVFRNLQDLQRLGAFLVEHLRR